MYIFEIECLWLEEGSNLNHHLFGVWGVLFFSLKITIEAMKSDIDEVALQGIEFWSNVCDEEMDLAIEASEVRLAESRFVGENYYLPGLWDMYILCGVIVLWENFILTGLREYLHL